MSKQFASSVAPLIERNITSIIHQTIVPSFRQGTEELLTHLMSEVRSEFVDVRKEIVAEQSEALSGTETQLAELNQTVGDLREKVERLESLLAKMSTNQQHALQPISNNLNSTSNSNPTQRGGQHGNFSPTKTQQLEAQNLVYSQQHPAYNVQAQQQQQQHAKKTFQHQPSHSQITSSSQATPPANLGKHVLQPQQEDYGVPVHQQQQQQQQNRPDTPVNMYEDMFLEGTSLVTF
jgi:predicted  nucleic acid-binding Zn-ribbon protein